MSDDDGEVSEGGVHHDDDSREESHLQYRRLRAPTESGQSLQIPTLSQTVANWGVRSNRWMDDVDVNGLSLAKLKQQARTELLRLASEYTRQYRDVDLMGRDPQSIVMAGHQPLLFHPGVWFKNFALASVSASVGATPVNLVVDNDVSGPAAIKCPALVDGKASTRLIDIDAAHAAVPHEVRPILDDALFDSFAERISEQLAGCFSALGKSARPLVFSLWRHVQAVRKSLGRSASLGSILAAGRHRLEKDAGLQTLEISVSTIAGTRSFAHFASSILAAQARFNEVYNARLVQYRDVHGIRSNAHPVPRLEQDVDWLESPFWVWSKDHPQRKRLFVKVSGNDVCLTDRAGWRLETQLSDLPSALLESTARDVAIRPRALITTLYSRLVLSDLFLHGIGGAKYDQLTDSIASDFFDVRLPPFSTLTATMLLPLGAPIVVPSDLSLVRQQIRQRRFHPERFIEAVAANEWMASKTAAIESPILTRLERHHAIEEANRSMQPFVAEQIAALQDTLSSVSDQIQTSRILNSREYSFCLFSESLADHLKRMANVYEAD